jgi:hypothetical protein
MTNLAVGGTTALPLGAQAGVVLTKRVDCSKTPLAAGAHEIINIPAGTYVAKTSVRVIKADTGASTRTFDVGDGATAAGYHSNIDAKTVAHALLTLALTEATPNTVTGFSNGKFYATADTIDITADQDLTNAIIEVKALVFAM